MTKIIESLHLSGHLKYRGLGILGCNVCPRLLINVINGIADEGVELKVLEKYPDIDEFELPHCDGMGFVPGIGTYAKFITYGEGEFDDVKQEESLGCWKRVFAVNRNGWMSYA